MIIFFFFKDILLACEYRKLWFSRTVHHQNDSMTYGKLCITKFYLSLLETVKCIKTKKECKNDLSLNSNETRISIDTKNTTFIIVKNSNEDTVFTISAINCVYKLLNVFRDILPNGAFINKDELSIVSTFIECVKTCADEESQKFSDLRSEDFISGEILSKNPMLDSHNF